MTIGHTARRAGSAFKAIGLSLALLVGAQAAEAAPAAQASAPAAAASEGADAAAATKAAPAAAAAAAPAAPAAQYPANHYEVAPGEYVPMKPVEGVGMPIPGALDVQEQFSPTGHQAKSMHDALVYIMIIIAVFVLGLLLYVMLRFNKRANPVPSKTSHNTLLEVVWTGIPILILVGISVPSVSLLRAQFKDPGKQALTIKATGSQWYWTYNYPDNGGFDVISNMLKEKGDPSLQPNERPRSEADGPEHLAADNRLVIPVGEDIRLQTTSDGVIHAFAIPSLWLKIDAVPGRLNERFLRVEKPGVYFGQCSELCGARHGYMPIVIEALPRPEYNRWVIAQGGKIEGAPDAPAAAPAAGAKPADAGKPAR